VAQFHRDVGRIARSVEKIAATMAQKAVDEPVAAPAPIKVWTGRLLKGGCSHILIVDLGADLIAGFDDEGNMFEAYTDLVQTGRGKPWVQVTTDTAKCVVYGAGYRVGNIITTALFGVFEVSTLRDSDGNPI
jgi:hypothetical protein